MSDVAILGAGPIGAAVAHKLAERERVRAVRLIDPAGTVAAGKALDIAQSGPVDGFDTRVTGATDVLAAVGAGVIVIADGVAEGEWSGEAGLAMLRQIVRAGTTAPFVFAGPSQISLLERCFQELKVPADRLIATAASSFVSSVRALAGIEINQAAAEVAAAGRPPELVVAWSCATAAGALLTERIAAHRLAAIARAARGLWPPGPQAIAAPTSLVVEALLEGSRQLHPAVTILDGELGIRGRAGLLSLELGRRRVLARHLPSLSPLEKVEAGRGFD